MHGTHNDKNLLRRKLNQHGVDANAGKKTQQESLGATPAAASGITPRALKSRKELNSNRLTRAASPRSELKATRFNTQVFP